MQRAVLYARAKHAKAGHTKGFEDDEDANIKIDVASERRKYQSFWVGVNRGIYIDSRNPKIVDSAIKDRSKFSKGKTKGLFDPHGQIKVAWDLFIAIVVIISVILVPVRIGFEPSPNKTLSDIEWFITSVFAVDICFTFNTAFLDTNTERIVYSRKRIALNYMTFWFWIDLVSTIPFDSFMYLLVPSSNLGVLRAVKILRLFRIFKLYRIFQLNDTLETLNINPQVLVLLTLMLQIFFVAHLFACFWNFLALPDQADSEPRTWANEFESNYDVDLSMFDRYVASFYYIIVTMLTIGYGDIHPTNETERVYSIVTMLTGGVVFGAMISKLAIIIEKRNPEAKALSHNMQEMKAYLYEISLPKDTRKNVLAAYQYYFSKKSAYGEPGFFHELPLPIMYRLVRQMNEDDIRSVKLFHTYEMDFVVPLLLAVKPFQAGMGDEIFAEGDVCSAIVFLKAGKISLSTSNGINLLLLGYVNAGGYFGDMEYLRNTTSIATYTVARTAAMLSVGHSHFRLAASKCLDGGVRFKEEIQTRYDRFIAHLKESKENKLPDGFDGAREEVDEFMTLASLRSTPHSPPPVTRTLSAERLKSTGVSGNSTNNAGASERARMRRHTMLYSRSNSQQLKKLVASKENNNLWIDGNVIDSKDYFDIGLHSVTGSEVLHSATGVEDVNVRVVRHSQHKHKDHHHHHKRKLRNRVIEMHAHTLYERMIFYPRGEYKIMWDFFVGILIVFSVIVVPVEIAFDRRIASWSFALELAFNCIFMLDILVSFRTAYYVPDDDAYEIEPQFIYYNYATTWFPIDFVASVPFGLIFESTTGSGSSLRFTTILKVLRLFRLSKLARIFKIGKTIDDLEERLGIAPAVFEMIFMLLEVFAIGHIVCCVLWGLSSVVPGKSWYEDPDEITIYSDYGDATLASQYLLSLYWTFSIMSTVGYGDISPVSTGERILNVMIIVFGASIFGYMIANVSSLIQSLDSSGAKREDRLGSVVEYLDEKQCPPRLRDAVVKHFRNYYKQSSAFDVDLMLSRLPDGLANEIRLIHNKKTLKRISILNYIDNVSVRLYIFHLMHPVFYEPNEIMLAEGAPGDAIMFLVEGKGLAFKRLQKRKPKLKKKGSHRLKQMLKQSFLYRGMGGLISSKMGGRLSPSTAAATAGAPSPSIAHSVSELPDGHSPQVTLKKSFSVGVDAAGANFSPDSKSDPSQGGAAGPATYDWSHLRAGAGASASMDAGAGSRRGHTAGRRGSTGGIALTKAGGGSGKTKTAVNSSAKSIGKSASGSGKEVPSAGAIQLQGRTTAAGDDDDDDDDDDAEVISNGSAPAAVSAVAAEGIASAPRSSPEPQNGSAKEPQNQSYFEFPKRRGSAFQQKMKRNPMLDSSALPPRLPPSNADNLRSSPATGASTSRDDLSRHGSEVDDEWSSHNNNNDDNNDNNSTTTRDLVPEERSDIPIEAPTLGMSSRSSVVKQRGDSIADTGSDAMTGDLASEGKVSDDEDLTVGELSQSNSRALLEGRDDSVNDFSASPRNVHDLLSPNHAHVKQTFGIGSDDGRSSVDSNHDNNEDEEEEEDENDLQHWSQEEFRSHGLQLIGGLTPGDFFGHMALLHQCHHHASVTTTAFCTVYTLSKQDIGRLLHRQPTVSIQLQMALSRAISTQSDIVGKLHMRSNRAEALKQLKVKFYHGKDIELKEVERITKVLNSRVNRMKVSLKQTLSFGASSDDKKAKPRVWKNGRRYDLSLRPESMHAIPSQSNSDLQAAGFNTKPLSPHLGAVDVGLAGTSFDLGSSGSDGVLSSRSDARLEEMPSSGAGYSPVPPLIEGDENEDDDDDDAGRGAVAGAVARDNSDGGDDPGGADADAANNRSNQRRRSMQRDEMSNTLSRRQVKMVKAVENVLSHSNIQYASDDENPDNLELVRGVLPVVRLNGRLIPYPSITSAHSKGQKHLKAHRSPLPPAALTRNAIPPARRATHSLSRFRSFASGLSITSDHASSLAESNDSADAKNGTPRLSQRLFNFFFNAGNEKEVRRFRGITRTMSLSDLDTLDGPLQNPSHPSFSGSWSSDSTSLSVGQIHAMSEGKVQRQLVPIVSNRRAVKKRSLTRRQSFPSYDNDLWKITRTTNGLL